MSFLRHREIYQVLEPCSSDELLLERARPSGHALTHRLDESPVGYSWRGALQQSPRPLHQPLPTLRQCRGELQVSIRWNMDPTLTRCLTLGAHPTRSRHTHLVRGGSVMLQPTRRRRTAEDDRSRCIPTSCEVGP
jgi:hypothetical protein